MLFLCGAGRSSTAELAEMFVLSMAPAVAHSALGLSTACMSADKAHHVFSVLTRCACTASA